jgi:hypothetical protein
MYRKQAFPQQRNQARARRIDRRKSLIWLFIVGASFFGLILSMLNVPKVTAATHASSDTYHQVRKHKQTQTVGYQRAWTEKLSGMAQEAFNEDEGVLAKRIWEMLAEEGNTEAAYKLAMLHDTGANGVEQDSVRAAYWYLKAAEAGHVHAQHNLAVAYASGDGVEMDISKAVQWWQRAARFGNSDSQYNLGILYAMGTHGIKKNLDKAKKWWRKAAMKGDPMAQYNLGTIYANGEGHVRSYCEAMRWWEKSASMGIQQASWALEIIKTRQDFHACW